MGFIKILPEIHNHSLTVDIHSFTFFFWCAELLSILPLVQTDS